MSFRRSLEKERLLRDTIELESRVDNIKDPDLE